MLLGASQLMRYGGPSIDCSTRRMKRDYRSWRMNWLTPFKELLAKQMASVSIKEGEGNALVADKRNFKGIQKRSGSREMIHSQFHEGSSSPRQKEESSNNGKKIIKCYRCGEVGHIKRFCRAKESYMAQTERAPEEEDWGRCFIAETRVVDALASLNFERGWTMDSGCGHHLTEGESKFFNFQENNGCDVIVTEDNTVHHVEKEDIGVINKKQEDSKDVQTSDVVTAIEEINEADPEIGNKSLNAEDVEVDPEHEVSETICDNGDHSEESIKGIVVEVEVSSQSSVVSKSITNSDQILEADGEADGQINKEVNLEGSISYGETNNMVLGCSEADKQIIEELKKDSGGESYGSANSSQEINGQIITDSGISPDNTIVKQLRERGSLKTQECETQHEDDSRASQRPKRNIVKSSHNRDENFEEGRSVEKLLLRSSPRHTQKLRLSSSTTSSG
ncbi:uncharacterized protein LOC132616160 [Lycium barbarum]|uniref:uncharacterized protein LOC132616160 n=1 Tax=Lycium barbarum TaxID=112863 RepID=UPI00293F1215|nr:uncharacterized protein LOC132616160 [Lycium barbarum]